MYNFFIYLGNLTTSVNSLSSEAQPSISLPPSLFDQYSDATFTLLFTMFNSSVLLPRNNIIDPRIRVASNVIGTTLFDHEVKDLDDNITLILHLQYPVSIVNSVQYYLVYFDF